MEAAYAVVRSVQMVVLEVPEAVVPAVLHIVASVAVLETEVLQWATVRTGPARVDTAGNAVAVAAAVADAVVAVGMASQGRVADMCEAHEAAVASAAVQLQWRSSLMAVQTE